MEPDCNDSQKIDEPREASNQKQITNDKKSFVQPPIAKSSNEKVNEFSTTLVPKFHSEYPTRKKNERWEDIMPMCPTDELIDDVIKTRREILNEKEEEDEQKHEGEPAEIRKVDIETPETPPKEETPKRGKRSPLNESPTTPQRTPGKHAVRPSPKFNEVLSGRSQMKKKKSQNEKRMDHFKPKIQSARRWKKSPSCEQKNEASQKTDPMQTIEEKPKKTLVLRVQGPSSQESVKKKDHKEMIKASQKKGKIKNMKVSQKDSVQVGKNTDRRRNGFLKKVYNKTKFWGRKSECVVNPTPEMLSRVYVLPEYDMKNAVDFQPDPKKYFSDEDYTIRVKTNPNTAKDEIFLNNRPFWLTRLPEDVIPKVRIQLHHPLKQIYIGNPSGILPRMQRTGPFYDPKVDSLEKLKLIDKSIGIDPADPAKEKELKRVCANTFYGTMMFEVDKVAWDDAQKKNESSKKRPGTGEKDLKTASDEKVKKVNWNIPEKYQLNTYNRKHRPLPVSSGCFYSHTHKRIFKTCEYKAGENTIPRKSHSPSVPSHGESKVS